MANTFGGFTTTTPDYRKQILDEEKDPYDIAKQPLFQQATQAISGQLAGQTPAFDVQATEARDAFKAAQAQQAKALRENLLQSGLKDTGKYVEEGLITPEREKLRQRMVLERGLTSDRATAAQTQVQQGLQNTTNLLGTQQTGEMQKAQLGSTEKIAFAGLSMDEKRLAQDAMQFTDRLAFDKWATNAGLDDKQKDRIWQGAENEKQRLSTEKMQGIEISGRAALQKDQNTWQAGQNDLNRELDKLGLNLQERQLAQQATQFDSKQAFDRWATEAGIANDVAGRVWEASENALNRAQEATLTREKFAQEENLLTKGQAFTAGQNALDRTLQSEIEAGRITQADKALAQNASQFKDEMAFKTWAEKNNVDEATASRVWATSERVASETHDQIMTELRDTLATKGIALQSVIDNIQNQYGDDPEKAAAMFDQIMSDNGVDLSKYRTAADTQITTDRQTRIDDLVAGGKTVEDATKEVDAEEETPTLNVTAGDYTEARLGADTPSYPTTQGWKPIADGEIVNFEDSMNSDLGFTLPKGKYKVETVKALNGADIKVYTSVSDPTKHYIADKNAKIASVQGGQLGNGLVQIQ